MPTILWVRTLGSRGTTPERGASARRTRNSRKDWIKPRELHQVRTSRQLAHQHDDAVDRFVYFIPGFWPTAGSPCMEVQFV